jgi:hypothetical protein
LVEKVELVAAHLLGSQSVRRLAEVLGKLLDGEDVASRGGW